MSRKQTIEQLVEERVRTELASRTTGDKQVLRDARSQILARLKSRSFNPREHEVAHVLDPSLSPGDVGKLVSSVKVLNAVLRDWQE